MANPEYVLEMRDIVKVFPGVRALDGVKLQVRPGKVHVICGENGAGKSTLMKIINGTYVADEGERIIFFSCVLTSIFILNSFLLTSRHRSSGIHHARQRRCG